MRCCPLARDAVAALTVGAALTACAAEGRGTMDDAAPVTAGTSALSSAVSSAVPAAVPSAPSVPSAVASAVPSAGLSAPASPPAPPAVASGSVDVPVIVTLAVGWQAENELLDHEIAAQRDRIRQAEEEVLRDLGTHGRLRGQLHQSGQTALLVDAVGLDLLRGHRLVAAVQEDRGVPAGAG